MADGGERGHGHERSRQALAERIERVVQRKVPGRVPVDRVVQEQDRCEDRDRRLASALQRGSAPLEPRTAHAERVQEDVVTTNPGSGHPQVTGGPKKPGRSQGLHRLAQRLEPGAAGPDPLGQRRARDRHAGAPVDLLLSIQRQVVGIFRDQHLRKQARRRNAFSITCGGTDAWISVSQRSQAHSPRMCRSTCITPGR